MDSRAGQRAAVTLCVTVGLLFAAPGWPRPADGARVLAFESVSAKSHWYFMKGVLRALADNGHRVTVYTMFPDKATPVTVNYTEVDTSAWFGVHESAVNLPASVVLPLFVQKSFIIPFMANGSRYTCDVMDELLANRGGDGDEFDLFLTEPLSSECVSHVARRLGLPLVYTVPSPVMSWIETGVFGHYANPAYVPHLLSTYSEVDTMYKRIQNVGTNLYVTYLNHRYMAAASAAENRHYDRVPPLKPSMVFVNTHYVTEPSRLVPVNRVDVGGIHLKSPEPLPADILEFIEDSPHGVIFFSLGTVVAASTLPDHIQKAFKDALAELPQRVLMKYEGEMKDKPKNMMTGKWFPQRDILSHPKVKLFIGHGGISGVYETVDAGVPMLGFPMFYDQPKNIDNLVVAGMALSLDLLSITKDTFSNAINEIINNKTYSENAKIVSERFKDRPMSPVESVVYWTEYVIRHKGAPHLKSHALNLTWYQYFLLDVVSVVLFVTLLVLYIAYRGFKCTKQLVCKLLSSKLKSKPE